MKYLTKKIVSHNFPLTKQIEGCVLEQFRRVSIFSNLGLVSRMLEIEDYVVVEDDAKRVVGIITHSHLLDFIANGCVKTY